MSVRRNLDCPKAYALGKYALYITVNGWAFKSVSHSITAVRDGIGVTEKAALFIAVKVLLLVTGNDSDGNEVLVAWLARGRQIQVLALGDLCAGKHVARL